MKARNIIVMLTVGLFLLGTLSAQAQRGMGHFKGNPEPGMQDGCKRLPELLELTPDQINKMKDSKAAVQKKMIPLQADLKLARLELREMMRSDASKSALEAKVDEIGKIKSTMQKIRIGHTLELKSMLTDEQKKKLESMPLGGFGLGHGMGRGCGHHGDAGIGPIGGDCPFQGQGGFRKGSGRGDCFWFDEDEI